MPATQGSPLFLRTLLPNARFIGGEIQFASLTSDHRQVQPGDLYVAVDGLKEDGHLFATEAVARGAAAVVAERHLPVGVPVATVDDSRTALGVLCQAFRWEIRPSRYVRLGSPEAWEKPSRAC